MASSPSVSVLQYFWFELSHWQHLLGKAKEDDEDEDEDEDEEDPVMLGAIARKVFEEASRRLDSPAALCSLLKIASEFEACRSGREACFGIEDIKR